MANEVTILVRAKDEASKVFSGIQGSAKSMAKGVALAAGGGALAVGGLAAASTKMAADFESSMSEVKTLLPDLDKEGFGQLKQSVLDFSKEMGVATDQAVPALYQAISAGVPQDNVMEFMRVASKAAIGGVTDLETAVDGITSVVNAYGKENIDAQRAADVMFSAVKNGKTDFEQLSRSLFNVIPTASSLGVGFEDIASQLAAMTAQGTPTSVATTQIRAAMVEASKTGTKLDKALRELTGEGFADLIASGRTMPEVFNELRESMPEQDFKDLFGSVEAMNAALGVSGPNFGTVSGFMDGAKESAGAVDEAFATVSDTAKFKLGQAMNAIKVTMIEFGSMILPHVADVLTNHLVPALERFGDWFNENKPQIQAAIAAILHIAGQMWAAFKSGWEVVGPLLQRFAQFIYDNKPLLVAAIAALGLAIVVALGPVSGAVAGILGLITLIGFMRDNWDEITAKIKEILASFVGWLRDRFFDFLDSKFVWLAGVLGPAGLLLIAFKFRDQIIGAFNAIKDAVAGAFAFISEKVAQIRSLVESIPTPGDIGGGILDAGRGLLGAVPGFAEGGVVPGPPGAPRLAVVHGGEEVRTPAQQRGAGGGMRLELHFHGPVLADAEFDDRVRRAVAEGLARGGFRGLPGFAG